jgi:hypothetical protein
MTQVDIVSFVYELHESARVVAAVDEDVRMGPSTDGLSM